MDTAFRLAVAAVLLGAALAKIRARREFVRGLEAYGVPGPRPPGRLGARRHG